jgi:hypothetical protein
MKLEGQNFAAVNAPSDHVLESRLLALKSYGRHSYASLTDAQGNYLQVAGGGVTCMVESFNVSTSTRLRAFHDKPSPVFPDGTVLAFGAGELRLKSDEWFHASAVVEIFLCFRHGRGYPDTVHWRPAPKISCRAVATVATGRMRPAGVLDGLETIARTLTKSK